jgi:hypothetical protein
MSSNQQNFVYLVSHCYELTSNAIFYTLEDAYTYIDGQLNIINKNILNTQHLTRETFYIYKVYIGKSFEAEIFEDGLEVIERVDNK